MGTQAFFPDGSEREHAATACYWVAGIFASIPVWLGLMLLLSTFNPLLRLVV